MTTSTVFVTRKVDASILRQLAKVGVVTAWEEERPIPHEELLIRVRDVDGLYCMVDDHIDRAVIESALQLKVISTVSAEVDHIDLWAAAERGITVCHTPHIPDDAVADLTMTLLLACARHIIDADHFVKAREWAYWSPDLLLGADVQGRTIGIIGLGSVGIRVAHRALGFGMRVLYYDARRDTDAEQHLGLQFGSLDNVLREADFVTVHVPTAPGTRGLIDSRRLRLMKPTAYLINMTRGSVVDHDALVRALEDGAIAGAGWDVFAQEPLRSDDPLLHLPNVVLTPHLGASTHRAMMAMMQMAATQLVQVLHGIRPAHVVAPPNMHRKAG